MIFLLYRAFREIGRVERTLFLLRFIADSETRRTIRAETTKIEAFNDLLRKYGKRAQTEHDRFVTELANGESSAGMHLGSDFCDRNGMIFTEVMALRSASELTPYAAGKDLVPATLEMCPEPKAPAGKAAAGRKSAPAPAKHAG